MEANPHRRLGNPSRDALEQFPHHFSLVVCNEDQMKSEQLSCNTLLAKLLSEALLRLHDPCFRRAWVSPVSSAPLTP
jgi:hypothetical protein